MNHWQIKFSLQENSIANSISLLLFIYIGKLIFGMESLNLITRLFAISILLTFSVGRAQDQSDLWEMSLEDLMQVEVDVASLFAQEDQIIGSTYSILTPSSWNISSPTMTYDALEAIPGVMIYSSIAGSKAVGIRGFAGNSTGNGIANLLDGAPINNYAFASSFKSKPNISLNLLKKIEIIRGPGSTIYGSDAFHGVISMRSWDPEKDTVEGGIAVGSYNSSQAHLKFQKKLLPQLKWTTALSLTKQEKENQSYTYHSYAVSGTILNPISTSTGEKTSEYKKKIFSNSNMTKINYKDSEFSLYWNQWEAEGHPGVRPLLKLQNGSWDYNIKNGNQGGSKSNWIMGNFIQKINLKDSMQLRLQIFRWRNKFTFYHGLNGGRPTSFLVQKREEDRTGAMLFFKGPKTKIPVEWEVGYSFDNSKVQDAESNITGSPATKAGFEGYKRNIHALIVQTDTKFMDDKMHFLLGSRWDDYSDVGDHFSPRAGLIYLQNKESTFKLLYGHAFRAPSASEQGNDDTINGVKGSRTLSPETINTYEFIYNYRHKNWKTTSTIFYSHWKNGIVLTNNTALSGEGFLAEYTNTLKSDSYGLESEYEGEFDHFEISSSFSYITSAKTTTGKDEYLAFPRYILNWKIGKPVEKYKLHFYLKNRHFFRVSAIDSQGTAPYANQDLKNYWRTDLISTWSFNSMALNCDLSIHIRNLFDQKLTIPSIWEVEKGIPDSGINGLLKLTANY